MVGRERSARWNIACVDAHNDSFAYYACRNIVAREISKRLVANAAANKAKEGTGLGRLRRCRLPLMQLHCENVTIES